MKYADSMCQSDNENNATVKNITSCDDSVILESVTSHNLRNSLIKLKNNVNKDLCFKAPDKQELRINSSTAQNELQKLNIPDTSVICLHTDNGQLFTISSDGVSTTLKNVTINTQNYITNTNITSNTVQTNVIEKIQKRKYSQVFENDSTEMFSKSFEQESPDNYSNIESVNSWPSTPSVSSETDKQTINYISEREFESCKDLLTKGDFSTLTDDSEIDLKKEGSYSESYVNTDIFDSKKDDLKKKDNLSCELCPYVFPNKTILAMHKQLIHKKVEVDIENKRKLLVCNLCPRTFNLQSSLMIHRKVAHAGGFGKSFFLLSNFIST